MWFYAALLGALISGIITIFSKHTLKTISPIVFFWAVLLVSSPFILLFAWKDGIPSLGPGFIIGIAGSVILYSIARIVFYHVIKDAHLSQVYPLVTLGPIFTLVFAFVILSEKPTVYALFGSLITLAGTYVLNISSLREGLLEPFKILFRNKFALLMLVYVVINGAVSVFDKLAINNTFPEHTSFALLIEDLVIIVAFLPWIIKERRIAIPEILNNKMPLLILGILGAASNILIFFAFAGGDTGIVTSIFRTQVFFVILLSFLFFKDRPKTETIIGTIVMILGLVITKLAS